MGRVVFLNPNVPEQPAAGVYRWFFFKDNQEFTLYVGESGEGDNPVGVPLTLARATSHLRAQYGANSQGALETDFVVGTAIKYLKSKGANCFWQHISNARTEKNEIEKYNPILQDGRNLKRKFKRKDDGEKWKKGQRRQAEKWLFERLEDAWDELRGRGYWPLHCARNV